MTSMTVIRTRLPTTLPAPLLLRGTSAEHALSPRLCTGSRCAIGHPRLRRQPPMASGCWSVVQPIVVRKREDKPCNFVCNKTMYFKNALFAALVSLLLLAHTCRASEEDEHENEDEHHEESKPFEANSVWGYSFLFNFLACLPSAFAIIVCLWAKLKVADKVITSLMVFASGVLIGGPLFHLLPDIADGSSTELNNGLTSIVLVVVSLMVGLDSFSLLKNKSENRPKNEVQPEIELQKDSGAQNSVYSVAIAPSSGDANKQLPAPREQNTFSYAALLQQPDVMVNLMGEALHNFNDGIAIATAFSLSWESGIAMFAVAIIHEIPCELSDVSIISKAGGTWVQCLVLNVLVACTSFIGVIVGASVATSSETASKVLGAINAGCFIYLGFRLALYHAIPKITSRIEIPALILVFNVGWICMLVLKYIEDAVGGGHGH